MNTLKTRFLPEVDSCDAGRSDPDAVEKATQPRSILHIVLRPRYSGAETLVKALLPRHAEHGCRIGLCSLLPSETAFLRELEILRGHGCEIFVPDAELKGIQRVRHIANVLQQFKPDLVIAHTVIPAAYARLAAIKKKYDSANVFRSNQNIMPG